MIYLKSFTFPNSDLEAEIFFNTPPAAYGTIYPFKVLSPHQFAHVEFGPVTIFCGGNGCGKTTALNVIAEKLGAERDTLYNRSSHFPNFVRLCEHSPILTAPATMRIITSDDVFDYILSIRTLNEGIDEKREELFEEYYDAKYAKVQMRTLDDYEMLRKSNLAKSHSKPKYVKSNLMNNVREISNGESAFKYFTEKIGDNGLYLLDEPENSLSPKLQLELIEYLTNAARFFGCQFIISTHSPFLLAMKEARIYDLDSDPVVTRKWSELPNMRLYYELFRDKADDFQ